MSSPAVKDHQQVLVVTAFRVHQFILMHACSNGGFFRHTIPVLARCGAYPRFHAQLT